MTRTPASLLQKLRGPPDPHDWARFVELYTPLLYAWARRAGLQEADAADLAQDALLLLVRRLPEFEYDRCGSFRAWLKTVALNLYRTRRRRATLPTQEGGPEPAGPDHAPEFEEAEYRDYLVRRALELMRREFPPATWKACWEYAVAGRPPADVARELGLSVNAVYLAKSRVLARLRQELAGLLD